MASAFLDYSATLAELHIDDLRRQATAARKVRRAKAARRLRRI
jgi:hypothetical protein